MKTLVVDITTILILQLRRPRQVNLPKLTQPAVEPWTQVFGHHTHSMPHPPLGRLKRGDGLGDGSEVPGVTRSTRVRSREGEEVIRAGAATPALVGESCLCQRRPQGTPGSWGDSGRARFLWALSLEIPGPLHASQGWPLSLENKPGYKSNWSNDIKVPEPSLIFRTLGTGPGQNPQKPSATDTGQAGPPQRAGTLSKKFPKVMRDSHGFLLPTQLPSPSSHQPPQPT